MNNQYSNHRFDLLGTGWVQNSYDSQPLGLEGFKYYMNVDINKFDKKGEWLKKILYRIHAKKAQELWELIDVDYIPIDWQKDFKCGYRWNNKSWYKTCNLVIGRKPGVDIKVPWELARMQHLPQMALYFQNAKKEEQEKICREIFDQVLDFIATNPEGFGVNWSCTMDVAIRAANILLALDLLKNVSSCLKDHVEKESIIAESIYMHGRFITENLEYSERFTGNHYLANICGLAFIAAYLEPTEETNCWLSFSFQELINEFKKQFYEDGSNFEASTSYHRLSTEMVLFTTALFIGLPKSRQDRLKRVNTVNWKKQPTLKNIHNQEYQLNSSYLFPEWYFERLFKAGCFTADLLKPNNQIPQIGDNDSGRFFKLTPMGEFLTNEEAEHRYFNLKGYIELGYNPNELYWDEEILDHRPLLSAFAGIFEYAEFEKYSEAIPLEKSIVNALFKQKERIKKVKSYSHVTTVKRPNLNLDYHKESIFQPVNIDSKIPLSHNVTLHPYPDSGIYILKSDRIHLTIMAGDVGQNGLGGHSHNDKLSIELNMDGDDIIVDPGTYLYTGLPHRRNEYRSTQAHSSIIVENEEQVSYSNEVSDLFYLCTKGKSEVVEIGNNVFTAMFQNESYQHIRQIKVWPNSITISDFCSNNFRTIFVQNFSISSGYGKLLSNKEDQD